EPLRQHQHLAGKSLWDKVTEALRLLRIPSPRERLQNYPHQMSGGMRQRVVGGIAISCRPKLIIADEPTTALDATIQAQYLALLNLPPGCRFAPRCYAVFDRCWQEEPPRVRAGDGHFASCWNVLYPPSPSDKEAARSARSPHDER